MSTPTPEDFRHMAVEALIDAIVTNRSEWPPAGWCEQFDQAFQTMHGDVPRWACAEPHAAFVEHHRAQCGENIAARQHALRHSLRVWLRSNTCAELERRERTARAMYSYRDEYPQDWAQYAAYLETNDIPY